MPPSNTLFAVQRFDWMGYHGTESKQLTVLGTQKSNLDYRYRQKIIAGIKERLYGVKRDLGLIPPEQLQAEEEARQHIRAAREQRELEVVEREREAAERERMAQEQECRAQSAAVAARGASVDGGHTACGLEAERSASLEGMPRQQAEILYALRQFTVGARALILSRDTGNVSHIDGSVHTSVDKLDARRVQEDPTYATRLSSSAKDSSGRPTTVVLLHENEDLLLNRLEQSKRSVARKQYNRDATAARIQVSV